MCSLKYISECFIKPKYEVERSKHPYYLSPSDLAVLSFNYIQNGLIFLKPSPKLDQHVSSTHQFLQSLKDSLSLTLVHFYPLAGQLATHTDQDRAESLIFVDCNKGNGAKFIHATVDMTVSEVLYPKDIPQDVVHSFFDHHKAVNHDGHFRPLLSVQVTELKDGVFIGCSMNHAVSDGTSYWHFWNVWSEIHSVTAKPSLMTVSRPLPVHDRWFPDGLTLPFTHFDQFITRYDEENQNQERIFHFSSESMARLKAKARKEINTDDISSLQALTAVIWRSIIRANCVPRDQVTKCVLLANNRHRFSPIFSPYYFGNCVHPIETRISARKLLVNSFGWVASLLHRSVANHDDQAVRSYVDRWLQAPYVYNPAEVPSPCTVTLTHSPRFDVYGNEFGLGRAKAVCSGIATKFGGVFAAYPGCEGGGSVDLEVCLPLDSMRALESDDEFMNVVS